MKYLIILEPTPTGDSAYSPDLDGCAAAGDVWDETTAVMKETIAFHLGGLAAEGLPTLLPHSEATVVEVIA